ncbi:hypothetical protein HYPSUDRAFT_651817 [Hypholoma sublateritium FD-334 SS-4]|uniref:Uncharacterized protein n=1 Tax=Hypholoma sublateritium (strain FD-334 SS-4) TaxID=945553 RepID=A0A0D2NUH6_HYPSF|nr:hypothetical protein HYPSUDRAFT_651817 [Hypholoma sublateritium FD-334 SS-4]
MASRYTSRSRDRACVKRRVVACSRGRSRTFPRHSSFACCCDTERKKAGNSVRLLETSMEEVWTK